MLFSNLSESRFIEDIKSELVSFILFLMISIKFLVIITLLISSRFSLKAIIPSSTGHDCVDSL